MFLGCMLILLINACKKDAGPTSNANKNNSNSIKVTSSSSGVPAGYTRTSAGLIPDSNVTLIEDGYQLTFLNGHAYKMHAATGKLVKDLGKVIPNSIGIRTSNPASPRIRSLNALNDAAIFGETTQGAVTYAEWANPNPANPITNFTSSFIVPQWPTTSNDQLFSIWMGLSPTSGGYPLIQPLLIWGNSGGQIGGGQYWTIVSYIIWESGTYNGEPVYAAAISTPLHDVVGPETALEAKITYVTNTGNSYYYSCQFVGYSSTTLNIVGGAVLNNANQGGTINAPTIPALNSASEVLEIPSGSPPTQPITSVYEYPAQFDVPMTSSITTGIGSNASNPTTNWQSYIGEAGLGEHTQVINSNNVDIYFQTAPTGTFPVLVYTDDSASIYFNLSINGSPPLNTYSADHDQNNTPVEVQCDELSNSTIIMTIVDAGGITPTSATLYNLGAPIQGVFSNGAFTFSHVNLTAGSSCEIVTN
jgi:hypothetical protein